MVKRTVMTTGEASWLKLRIIKQGDRDIVVKKTKKRGRGGRTWKPRLLGLMSCRAAMATTAHINRTNQEDQTRRCAMHLEKK
jgi:hypothetical protein